MRNYTKKWLLASLLLGTTVVLYSVAKEERPALFQAYTDNLAGVWSLTLYEDGGFAVYLPTTNGRGNYRLSGDTILLQYDTLPINLLAAYFVNRSTHKIDELSKTAGGWTIASPNNWAMIQLDSLPQSSVRSRSGSSLLPGT